MKGIEIVDSDAKNDDYQLSSNEEDDDETSPTSTNTQKYFCYKQLSVY